METETISSRNIVDLLFRERFNSGICGFNQTASAIPNPEAEQVVLNDEAPKTEKVPDDDDDKNEEFVLGWDC